MATFDFDINSSVIPFSPDPLIGIVKHFVLSILNGAAWIGTAIHDLLVILSISYTTAVRAVGGTTTKNLALEGYHYL